MALRLRKNAVLLTDAERKQYVDALLAMKKSGAYDYYVKIHLESMDMTGTKMNMWAHQRPGFLPWHRQLCLDFENDLRAADMKNRGVTTTDLALPYWEWVFWQSAVQGFWWARIWDDAFMGPDGDASADDKVKTGICADPAWTPVYIPSIDPPLKTYIQRTLGRGGKPPIPPLPNLDQYLATQQVATYDVSGWATKAGIPSPIQDKFAGVTSYRNCNEGWITWKDGSASEFPTMHNRVHLWVGGSMSPISSPNDPIFFLHHCNVDRMFADWWNRLPAVKKATFYAPADGEPNPPPSGPMPIDLQGHHPNDVMPPWDGTAHQGQTKPVVRVKDVFDHNKLGYRYDTDPPPVSSTP